MQITAPNYTQIPNVVFDYWMHVLSHVEFKILLAICRKTFGWHKDRDSLSIRQIMQMTGINGRSTVCNALKKLEDEKLIKKTKTKTDLGDDAPNKYEIDVHLLEGGSPTVGLRSPTNGEGVVLNSDQGVVLELDTQKKENIQKKKNIYLDFVLLTEDEHKKLLAEHGMDKLNRMLETLNSYLGSSGKKYKSHYFVLKKGGWVEKAIDKETPGKDGKPSSREDANYLKVKGKFKNRAMYNGAECILTEQAISFSRGMTHYQLSFKEQGFDSQLDSILRKLGINV